LPYQFLLIINSTFTIHTIEPTSALMLNYTFYTQSIVTPICFDLSWSSSRSYWTSIKHRLISSYQINAHFLYSVTICILQTFQNTNLMHNSF